MPPATNAAFRHRVTAAMLTPFDAAGVADVDAAGDYAASLVRDGAGALAVGAHTGRGLLLTDDVRRALIAEVRAAVDVPIVAGIGLRRGEPADPSTVEHSLADAGSALAEAGADAVMIYPVPRGVHHDIAGLHTAIARATGLPVIAFVLYEAASGHRYPVDLARRIVAADGVLGVKLALLDDAVACQDVLAACRAERPDAVLFTGEDRMFGPSLLWGADAALVGIAAAAPQVSVAVLDAWTRQRYPEFVTASRRLDALAALTFRSPVDGYVRRMAWLAAWEGRLPRNRCHDPVPAQSTEDEERFVAAAAELLDAVRGGR